MDAVEDRLYKTCFGSRTPVFHPVQLMCILAQRLLRPSGHKQTKQTVNNARCTELLARPEYIFYQEDVALPGESLVSFAIGLCFSFVW